MSASLMPLIPEQRQQEILRVLRAQGVLGIRNLTDLLNVSHMTVRRDIAALEESGLVTSVQGGVRLADWTSREPPRERVSRAQLELPRKQAVAELGAGFVEDGMVIFLDAGTTCQSIVPFLRERKNVTVVTNDFYVVTSLFDYPNIETIHTGGLVDASSGSSCGRLAAQTLSSINLDLFFLSTGTWSLPRGVTTPSLDKVEIKLAALKAASACFLLADSTKFCTVSKFLVAPLERLDAIVTDEELPVDAQDQIRGLGVNLHLASVEHSLSAAQD
ncbi:MULTISPECIES: DeoR/GlpR family DNA-binding transcription regulator [unclassified Cryobacterium]|uniref:DeoR/GlpR family DNA-binding transcription regulator n=2 Tax=Cryobacterium TaxID=69578 RepID=UPI002AB46985|nr:MULTISPECIES: DeoR/GlpR family DNA-binding transcription regulator [unclassified Cryobacterium]MDY7527310.1 DeoR/GlpR family DNA-binding transcription regulator [Cryobacterium sp. 10C2]MEB0003892.1 DeoR/GlpR family DNA-binding transcription regulator [Cryobacterium sp. RTC2.1]MEB0202716.1 DeoR/GlpR family DNA-binding transcription regulator [Cryobacterium sp. 5I3]MEB0285820.1 DeoR/GlpR family DNA-binding transcription regulator [Cryobacterium sp. 10S3]MEB0291007.1 DeoR/GlpR family DNA-bindi